jgi:hypothetical protein
MTMLRAYLRRVSQRTVEGLLAEPARIEAVMMPADGETAIDDDVQFMVAAYADIDRALGADAFLVKGGTPVGDIVFGEGPARAFTAADVRKLATRLALAPAPTGIREYAIVKQFVTDTARAEAAMIITIE